MPHLLLMHVLFRATTVLTTYCARTYLVLYIYSIVYVLHDLVYVLWRTYR